MFRTTTIFSDTIEADTDFSTAFFTPAQADAISAKLKTTKSPPPKMFKEVLTKFSESKDEAVLDGTTFKYVYAYFQDGVTPIRLKFGLEDVGYTMDELDALKDSGKSIFDVVDEILSRK